MRAQIKKDKIQEALEFLDSAAQEKKEEVFELLGDKYEHLKEFVQSAAHNGGSMAGHAKKQVMKSLQQEEKKIKQTAAQWDKKIHKEPWVFVGSAALGALVVGLLLGRKN